MNTLKAIIAVGLTLTTSCLADDLQEKAQKIQALYNQGLIAANQGKAEEAKTAFTSVLALDPSHGHARYQLTQLPATVAKVQQAKRLGLFNSTMIKEVNFNQATLAEALEALDLLASEATEKKFTPNFVIQDPTGSLEEKKITLKMSNVPLSGILKYVMDLSGTTARFDEHATVIRPSDK